MGILETLSRPAMPDLVGSYQKGRMFRQADEDRLRRNKIEDYSFGRMKTVDSQQDEDRLLKLEQTAKDREEEEFDRVHLLAGDFFKNATTPQDFNQAWEEAVRMVPGIAKYYQKFKSDMPIDKYKKWHKMNFDKFDMYKAQREAEALAEKRKYDADVGKTKQGYEIDKIKARKLSPEEREANERAGARGRVEGEINTLTGLGIDPKNMPRYGGRSGVVGSLGGRRPPATGGQRPPTTKERVELIKGLEDEWQQKFGKTGESSWYNPGSWDNDQKLILGDDGSVIPKEGATPKYEYIAKRYLELTGYPLHVQTQQPSLNQTLDAQPSPSPGPSPGETRGVGSLGASPVVGDASNSSSIKPNPSPTPTVSEEKNEKGRLTDRATRLLNGLKTGKIKPESPAFKNQRQNMSPKERQNFDKELKSQAMSKLVEDGKIESKEFRDLWDSLSEVEKREFSRSLNK